MIPNLFYLKVVVTTSNAKFHTILLFPVIFHFNGLVKGKEKKKRPFPNFLSINFPNQEGQRKARSFGETRYTGTSSKKKITAERNQRTISHFPSNHKKL